MPQVAEAEQARYDRNKGDQGDSGDFCSHSSGQGPNSHCICIDTLPESWANDNQQESKRERVWEDCVAAWKHVWE